MAILLISPEPWDAHAVSKHHYARTLVAEGHQVLFLDPPVPGLREISMEPVPSHPRLIRVRAPRVAPGLRRLPAAARRWLEQRWLRRLEQQLGSQIEVVWLFENSRFFDLRFASSRLKIYHQVDLNQNFQPAIAARTADICFCTSDLIRKQLQLYNSRCYHVNHGVALPSKNPQLTEEQRHRFRVQGAQAVYVGNLDIPYLDWDVLHEVVQQHPDVRFHFVGNHTSACYAPVALYSLPNVIWWGKVSSSLIPSILERADVLLLIYSQVFREQVSNPHKLMEYMASGRTVVATYTAEYEAHQHLLAMSEAGCNAGYAELFTSVVTNLNAWNTPERIYARRFFAADHTYPRQLMRIQDHLMINSLAFPMI